MTVTGRRWALAAIGVAGSAWAIGGERLSVRAGTPENHVFDLLVGLVYLAAGLVTSDRRPGNPIGALMLVYSFTWYLGNWGNAQVPVLANVGAVGGSLGTAVLIHMAFAYPSGRLRRDAIGGYVLLAYAWIVGSALLTALTWDPGTFGACRCEPAPLALFPNAAIVDALAAADAPAQTVLALAGLGLLIVRWVGASPAARREAIPWSLAVGLLAAVFVLDGVAGAVSGPALDRVMTDLLNVCRLLIPLVLLWGLLESRLAQSAIGDLVVELQAPMTPVQLRRALGRAVKDPSLAVAFRRDRGGWVDERGEPIALPRSDAPTTVTLVGPTDRPAAALIHDPGLDAGLVQAAGAAAALALENAALHAEVRAQLADVRASRARILEAGDTARRRLERDLHDGAQQRLLALSFALRSAARRADAATVEPELRAAIARADAELGGAIAELRDLAHGIHPAILTDEGLGPALEDLAERAPMPVTLRHLPTRRVDAAIEATAYFVVAEALSNSAKHAPGAAVSVEAVIEEGRLIVSVVDDGGGGADVNGGSGLRGLRDRVAAVNGILTIDSPAGGGTALGTQIPCA